MLLKVLNLGSGKRELSVETFRVDINPATNPDLVHDLNQTPWPIESEQFDEIYCVEVIEHLTDVVKTMEEIHRVGKSGAKVHITTPHYSCSNSFTDPTHKHHLGFFSFDYFTGQNEWDFYTKARFKRLAARINFYGRYKNFHVSWFANKFPRCYEEHFAWAFPAWYLSFQFEILKGSHS